MHPHDWPEHTGGDEERDSALPLHTVAVRCRHVELYTVRGFDVLFIYIQLQVRCSDV